MNKKLLTLLIALIAISFASAQVSVNSHLSYKDKAGFCIPQLATYIEMPPNTGFLTYYQNKDKSLTNLKEQYVVTFLDTTSMDKPYTNYVSFELRNGKKKEYLELYLQRKSDAKTKEEIAHSKDFVEFLEPILTKYGNTNSYIGEIKNTRVALHSIEKEGYNYLFAYRSDISPEGETKAKSMIKSISRKELPEDIRFYNNRIKLKELDKNIENTKAQIQFKELKDLKGRTKEKTLFELDEVGLSLEMPSGTTYSLQGTDYEVNSNRIRVLAESVDPGRRMSMIWLNHRDILFNVRTFYESEIPDWFNDMLLNSSYKQNKALKVNIDGHTLPAVTNSGNDNGYINTLNIYYQYDSKLVLLNFNDITLKNAAQIDQVIASMKLKLPKKISTLKNAALSKLLHLTNLKDIAINKNFEVIAPKLSENYTTITLNDLRVDFGIWGQKKEIQHRMNFGDYKSISSTTINTNLKNSSDSYSITNYNTEQSMSVFVEKVEHEDQTSIEEDLVSLAHSYSAYKYMKTVEASLVECNGFNWSVFISQSNGTYSAQVKCYIGDYRFSIFLMGKDLESIKQQIGIIDTFIRY